MTTPILLDFESRSRADLKAIGGRNYWSHPSTVALCCSWHDPNFGDSDTWMPGEPCPFPDGAELAAHNAMGFDRFGVSRVWPKLKVSRWHDTSELARRAGLPGGLDELGKQLAGKEKDKVASRYTKSLSSIRRPKHIKAAAWKVMPDAARRRVGALPPLTEEALEKTAAYCESDVEIMRLTWPTLEEWVDLEPDIERADRAVNERGVAFDSALAVRLLEQDARLVEVALAKAAAEMGLPPAEVRAMANSPKQFCEAVGTLDARKGTLEGLDHPLVRARQALASINRGKLLAGLLRSSPDGRIRDSHYYYGATTGRWSQRGMQLHNLPRPDKRFEEWGSAEVEALADQALAGAELAADEVTLLVRATLCAAPGKALVVRDFSGVEARALAWASGDHKALRVFTSGVDAYKVAASAIFGVRYDAVDKPQRQIGKVAELACGYQGGAAAFERMALNYRINLDGLDLWRIVRGWRSLHAPAVKFWKALETAFARACEGAWSKVACFDVGPSTNGKDVAIILPTGRPVVYRNARYSPGSRESLSFDGLLNGAVVREYTYGGKLAENAIQALCRELMAYALVDAEDAGLCPVLTVHDEIACEVDCSQKDLAAAELQAIMTRVPEWVSGFPLAAAGFEGLRYRK